MKHKLSCARNMEYKWAKIKWAIKKTEKQTNHVLIIECAKELQQQQQPQPKRVNEEALLHYTHTYWSCFGSLALFALFEGKYRLQGFPGFPQIISVSSPSVSSVATAFAPSTTTTTTTTYYYYLSGNRRGCLNQYYCLARNLFQLCKGFAFLFCFIFIHWGLYWKGSNYASFFLFINAPF